MAYLGGFDPSTSLRTSEVRCKDYTTQHKGLWTIVSGAEKRPDDSKADLQAKWDVRADKAAGQLYLSLSAEQRTHIDAVQDDPVQIWSTLESIHLQQRPGARFNAWDDFFLIRKKQDESLTSLITRIEDSMSKIQ